MLGKFTNQNAELIEQDRLLEDSQRLIHQRSVGGGSD